MSGFRDRIRRASALALLFPPLAGARLPVRAGGEDLIGAGAPPLVLKEWLNSPPLEVAELEGKVLLLRWWTDTCPFCEASAPALKELDLKYRGRGLVVIGVFHPKPPGDPSLERVRAGVERFGFGFPVALDADWKALRRWWLVGHPEGWTSVSFVVDRKGVIRYVHPGGEYHTGDGGGHWPDHSTCRREYHEIERTIVRLLEE